MPFQPWRRAAFIVACLLGGLVGASGAALAGAANDLPEYKPDAIPHAQYQTPPNYGDQSGSRALMSDGSRLPEYFLAIYSGSTAGSYFQVATTICDVMQERFEEHRIRCVPLRSQGVASNRELMRQGRAQVILVQSDTNWRAAQGDEPIPSGRSVAALHDEAGLLVARRDANVRGPADLRGKRISAGTEGSAARVLWVDLLTSMGMTQKDFEVVYSLGQEYNTEGVCDNYIDAFGLWIGHPSTLISRTQANCAVTLAGMAGSGAEKMLVEKPYYFRQKVPAGTYKGQVDDIDTYGLKAVLVADSRAEPHIVYWLTRTLAEDIEELQARNPILGSLDAEAMFANGNFLPFHDGAARYWREAGRLQPAVN